MKFDVMRHVIELCLSDFQSRARLLIIHFFFRPQPVHPLAHRYRIASASHHPTSFHRFDRNHSLNVWVCMPHNVRISRLLSCSLAHLFCVSISLSHCFFLVSPKTQHINDIVCGWATSYMCFSMHCAHLFYYVPLKCYSWIFRCAENFPLNNVT